MSEYVKHEILLPKELSEKIPKGSRLVFRPPKAGESYIDDDGNIFIDKHDWERYPYIVIEPAWQAPDWMPKGWWLAMDADGEWILFKDKPVFMNSEYWWFQNRATDTIPISEHFNWTPPSVDGAEDSLRQI